VPLSIQQLLDSDIDVSEEVFEGATDPVSYCFFDGGGLISYRKKDGYLHTLCDAAGMNRKLAMLKGERSEAHTK
jgi:hypothetical protein